MSFGKYTLYSCYGTTANCNTFPVALAILFGNEDKEGWVQFWNFAKSLHPSLDKEDTTIITDQAKGLKEALAQELPRAGHFLCSFHRQQNIAKIVKGGNVEYSCVWMFKKLLSAHNKAEISHLKHKYSKRVNDRALKYLNSVPDE
jgi:transposase-like protein